jgi:hypothetical protein
MLENHNDNTAYKIELALQKILYDIRTTKDTEVDFDFVENILKKYDMSNLDNVQDVERWRGYLKEILLHIDKDRNDIEQTLQSLVASSRTIAAYNKSISTANHKV